jgi:transcriptional regulator
VYSPKHFEENRIDAMHALMRAYPLATLVAVVDATITANHIPVTILDAPAPYGVLQGHVARANSLWRQAREDLEALAIFQGPQVYISPSLYATKRRTGEVVPTWDYAVVHARGTLRFIEDAAWLRDLVGRLTDVHEAQRGAPWKVDDAPAPYIDRMLAAIVGFEFSIASLSGKWKVSQNRDRADREGVVAGLGAADDADSHEIAEMLAARGGGGQ